MIIVNDKLKGEFYRSPMTKLASRKNVSEELNALIEYFNGLTEKLDVVFNRVTSERKQMKQYLLKIYEKTVHFRYILEHFKLEVDEHITERLSDAIASFQNNITNYVKPYETNLFNHSTVTDSYINNESTVETLNEWKRQTDMLASSLGIRWFGGKIDGNSIVNEIDNILRIVKINTADGNTNEDYITSNLILELFIYTSKGMIWLVLGKNATFTYNLYVKYRSNNATLNCKLVSESYDTIKEYDINKYDFDMILNMLLSEQDVKDTSSVYIKVKTNIPSNTEAGRESYYITSSEHLTDYEQKKYLTQYGEGLKYHDNIDLELYQHDISTIEDIYNKKYPATKTRMLINPIHESIEDFNFNSKENYFSNEIKFTNSANPVRVTYNANNETMERLQELVSPYYIINPITKKRISNSYFDVEPTFNTNYSRVRGIGEVVKYETGDKYVNFKSINNVGKISIISKNETMFEFDNIFSKKNVLPSDLKYGTDLKDRTIENSFKNDENFDILANDNINEYIRFRLDYEKDGNIAENHRIYCTFKTKNNFILIGREDGLWVLDPDYPNEPGTMKHTIVDRIIYDIVSDQYNQIFLCTSKGITKLSSNYVTMEQFGIVQGKWTKFVKLFNEDIIAINHEFSLINNEGITDYGDALSISHDGAQFTLLRNYISDDKYYTVDDVNILTPLADSSRSNIYFNDPNSRYHIHEYNVLKDEVRKKYYIFRYGQKMLSLSSPNDPFLDFRNFTIVNGLKDYDITTAILDENKIYFSTYGDSNYIYDIPTDTVEPINYNYTKVVNSRTETHKVYYLMCLNNLFQDDTTPDAERKDCFVLKLNNKYFYIPYKYSDIYSAVYLNDHYYFLTTDKIVYKLDNDFNIISIIKSKLDVPDYGNTIVDILAVDHLLIMRNTRHNIVTYPPYDDYVITTDVTPQDRKTYYHRPITKIEYVYDLIDFTKKEEYINSDTDLYYKNHSTNEYIKIDKIMKDFYIEVPMAEKQSYIDDESIDLYYLDNSSRYNLAERYNVESYYEIEDKDRDNYLKGEITEIVPNYEKWNESELDDKITECSEEIDTTINSDDYITKVLNSYFIDEKSEETIYNETIKKYENPSELFGTTTVVTNINEDIYRKVIENVDGESVTKYVKVEDKSTVDIAETIYYMKVETKLKNVVDIQVIFTKVNKLGLNVSDSVPIYYRTGNYSYVLDKTKFVKAEFNNYKDWNNSTLDDKVSQASTIIDNYIDTSEFTVSVLDSYWKNDETESDIYKNLIIKKIEDFDFMFGNNFDPKLVYYELVVVTPSTPEDTGVEYDFMTTDNTSKTYYNSLENAIAIYENPNKDTQTFSQSQKEVVINVLNR